MRLGKSLDKIPFDKIYEGMRVVLKWDSHGDDQICYPGTIIKKKVPLLPYWSSFKREPVKSVIVDFDNDGPIEKYYEDYFKNLYYLET